MFFGQLQAQQWVPVRKWRAEEAGASADMGVVLTITSSLTRFLERHYGMRLTVRLHDQAVDRAEPLEAKLLDCAATSPALRRRVSLLHRDSVMFDAESVLPLEDLPTDLVQELQEGEKPLGNLLLDRGLSLSRSDLSVTRIADEGMYADRWARRSVLRSPSGTRALVVEVFHQEIWKRLQQLGRRYK
ncbi:MAG: chorismate--pyruvate lyase family protein [Mariprofundaceae bacterium]